MQFTSTIIYTLLSLAPLAAQADLQLDDSDYSQACQSICRPVHDLTEICDVDSDQVGGDSTEDRLELQCICTNDSFDVGSVAPLCQSCMQQNPDDDDDDNDDNRDDDLEDINEIVSRCGFSPATYTGSDQASSASSIIVNAERPTAASQLTTTITGGGGQSTATNSVTSTATGTASGTTSETTATGTSITTSATTSATTSDGAAATTSGVTVSGASHLGSHPGVGALLLTCVIGAAGLGAWVI